MSEQAKIPNFLRLGIPPEYFGGWFPLESKNFGIKLFGEFLANNMKKQRCYHCQNNNLYPIVKIHWPIKQCLNCGLVQVNPLPSKNDIEELYRGDYYKNFAPYLSQLKTHQIYFRKQIIGIKKYIKSGKLLDVGCALGPLLIEAEKQGFEAEGIDISDYAANYCKKLGLNAMSGTINDLKPSKRYDIITMYELLEHEREPLRVLVKAKQFLNTKGLLVITTPNYDNFFRKILGRFWVGYHHKEHLYFFTPKTIRLILVKAGFKNIVVKKDISRPYPIDYFFRRLADYLPYFIIKDIFVFLAKLSSNLNFSLPINPWDNLIIYGRQ